MPVIKVQIKHKFGIVSQNKRLELQKRILNSQSTDSRILTSNLKENPYSVTEEFVAKYNEDSSTNKESLCERAQSMLLRAKRRCGLNTNGEGRHVDLNHAWSELAVLAQCGGSIKEECFETLASSLNSAPLSQDHVETLFFLAESVMYWLQMHAIKNNFIRVSELKLAKVGELVFTRLLYHKYVGNLHDLIEQKKCLKAYMTNLNEHANLYATSPSILISIKLMTEIGNAVVESESGVENEPCISACIHRSLLVWKTFIATGRSQKQHEQVLKQAMSMVFLASHEFNRNGSKWLDAYTSVSILGEVAKRSLVICNLFQDLARGVTVEASNKEFFDDNHMNNSAVENFDQINENSGEVIRHKSGNTSTAVSSTSHGRLLIKSIASYPADEKYIYYGIGGWPWKVGYQFVRVLSDICLNGQCAEIQKCALLGKWSNADVSSFKAGKANTCIESCSIVDLLEFTSSDGHFDRKEDWKIRYAALHSLYLLTKSLKNNKQKEGLRCAAWSLINAVKASQLCEDLVKNSLTVAQIESPSSNKNSKGIPVNLWLRITNELCKVYLSHKPSIKSKVQTKNVEKSTQNTIVKNKNNVVIKRPTIRQEVSLHNSLPKPTVMTSTQRGLHNLNRIVVEQLKSLDHHSTAQIDRLHDLVESEKIRRQQKK